jgi:hypothetical protein
MPKEPYKIVKRSVKHIFTTEEVAQLNTEFRQSFANLKSVEAEFDSVKASYKAKTTEAESRMETLNATLQAGFEHREKPLAVVMDMKLGKKFFYLESDLVEGELPKKSEPVIVEAVTDADRQQELLEAEAKFESKEDIQLFQATENDRGVLTVGRLDGKWYSALRVKIGTRKIEERLDSEQACSKKRFDQITRSCKFFSDWLDKNLGREEAKGFKNGIELVKAEHTEREE